MTDKQTQMQADADNLYDAIDKIAPRLSVKMKCEIVEAAWDWSADRNKRAARASWLAFGAGHQDDLRAKAARFSEFAGIADIRVIATEPTKA